MATSSTSSPTFTGSSSYASDLQSAISRAVSFANLPVQILQNKQTQLNNQQTALSSVLSKFQSLGSALSAVETAATSGSMSATAGDSSIVTASAGKGAQAGKYTVNVVSTGSQTNAISADGLTTVTDPTSGNVATGQSFTLTVDGTAYNLTDSSSSLNGLADAINSSGAGVTATVINIGGTSSPDYRLSILSDKYSPSTISLTDSSNNALLNTLSTGSYVTYQVNGQPSTPINSDSRSLTFAAGLTVNVLKTGSTDVTVGSTSANLSNALALFASTYNNAVDELSKSRGQNNGPLSGESIVYALSQNLRDITSSGTATGAIQSIADLGLTYDKDGHLNFDLTAFTSAMNSNPADVTAFLGSSTSGFLQTADAVMNGIDDSTNGSIATMSNSITNQLSNISDKISSLQDRIQLMQTNLTAKMTQADTLIASLEQQNSYFTNLFAQMRANQQSMNG